MGGTAAEASAYPWLAALGTPIYATRAGGQFCAGALVAPDRVVTAGHCGAVAKILPGTTVTFGRTNMAGPGGLTVAIKEVRLHPDFRVSVFGDDLAFHNDIAMLTLAEPVALPTLAVGPAHGDSAEVVGWGVTADDDMSNSRLHSARIPLLADDACAAYGAEFDPVRPCARVPLSPTAPNSTAADRFSSTAPWPVSSPGARAAPSPVIPASTRASPPSTSEPSGMNPLG